MILNGIQLYGFECHSIIWYWMLSKYMILNEIQIYDILNAIQLYDSECHWNIWFWIIFNYMILNFIKWKLKY